MPATPIALELGVGTAGLRSRWQSTSEGSESIWPRRWRSWGKPEAHRLHATLGDVPDAATLASVSGGVRYDLVYRDFDTLTALPDAAERDTGLDGVSPPGGSARGAIPE